MKKTYKNLIIVFCCLLVVYLSSMYYFNWRVFTNANNFSGNIIMHSGGSIDGVIYTNSIEAFDYNYAEGNKLFEFDLVLSSDGELISTHEFEEELIGNGFSWENRPSLSEFQALKIAGEYTGVTASSIIGLLQTYPDITIITDTKENNPLPVYEKLVQDFLAVDEALLNRIVPYIYDFDMYDELEEIYPFNKYDLLEKVQDGMDIVLPSQIVNFLESHEKVVAFTTNRTNISYFTNYHINKLNKLQKQVFVYTINDLAEMSDYINRGVTGFISDDISITEYNDTFLNSSSGINVISGL